MICFVVALPAEAHPIIKHYQLQAFKHDSLFPIYQNQHISLIISGSGKIAAAAAVSYLYSFFKKDDHVAWLNVGIAGHDNLELGKGFLAHKIHDDASQRAWYPPRLVAAKLQSLGVITVDKPTENYSTANLYEMEASGFYKIASSCSSSEIVQCYKVISDNRESHINNINAKLVKQLIGDNLDNITFVTSSLQETASKLDSIHCLPDLFFELTNKYHFTKTQQHQLKQLLRNWQTLAPEPLRLNEALIAATDATRIISTLYEQLNRLPTTIKNKAAVTT